MKKALLLLLLPLLIAGTVPLFAGRTENFPLPPPTAATPAAAWKCNVPDAVAIDFEPGQGQFGKGVLRFQVRRAAGIVEVSGEPVSLPLRDHSVSARRIQVSLTARTRDFPDGAVQVRFRTGSQWAQACRPRRDWDTIIDINRMYEWKNWTSAIEYGVIANSVRTGRLCFRINTARGKGVLEIENPSLAEQCVFDHHVYSSRPDNLFAADQGRIAIDWYDPDRMTGGTLTLKDETGRELRRLRVNPGTRSSGITLPQRGFYTVEANAAYRDGSKLTTVRTAGVVGAPIPEAVRRQSRYGIMRVHASSDWAVNFGANLDWGFWTLDAIKPGPDGRLVSTMTGKKAVPRRQFLIAGMHGVMPTWLRSPKCRGWELMPPRDWKLFADAVELWARTNPDLPDIVTVYNEPDAHWYGTDEDFVRFHQETARAVKKGRPGAKVGGPCMYGIRMKDFRRYVEKGVLEGMDCVVMHAYVNGTAPEGEFIERICALQDYLKTTKYANLPLYITEFGWTSPPGDWQKPVDELTKARYCVRSQLLCAARNIGGLIYFNARYCQLNDQYSYSIVKPDYTPLPAAVAYATFLREMSPVKGGGQWLRLAPDIHWTAFERDGRTLAALWKEQGNTTVTLPAVPLSARSMTGSPLPAVRTPAISPDPVYFTFAGKELLHLPLLPTVKALPGDTVRLDGSEPVIPPGLKAASDAVTIPENADLGAYTVILRNSGRLAAQPIEVLRPLEGRYVDTRWNGGTDAPSLEFQVRSRIPGRIKAVITLKSDAGLQLRQELELPSGAWVPVSFKLDHMVQGQRYQGKADLTVTAPIRWRTEIPFDTTMIAVPLLRHAPATPPWRDLPAIDFTPWQGAVGKFAGRSDCHAALQAFAAPDGLYLRVTVGDDRHLQSDLWQDMWKEDSLQIAFDVDTDREWQPNNVGHGLNGHRVVEYMLGLRSNGRPMGWRPISHLEGLKSGPAFELMKHAQVTRDEAARTTVYQAFFPWRLLGLDGAPAAGSRLGFALAVNDKDPDRPRRMLRLFNGIVDGKDPVRYGRLWLVGQP